ncbi:alpha-glucosidase [Albimonas donghaensis]|uniref:Alpha-glucosidase n=1 Tax=Albimonas donghaensis TaxID=356660 RepID=A0A1H3DRG4_9RHOB|nr:alpha-amylase family glycosyl hydrolase [Albimonas donghaensis]SDX68986.1 alpha-glucosidase [Albimonas donghaensis]
MICRIYPRSYQDTIGNGVGDLPGVLRRLDHIADPGVDAIWLSPFVASPMRDFGYDVSDYLSVDPMFGTLEDLRALVEAAHARGLKVLMDQVRSHSSNEHPWFLESRGSPMARGPTTGCRCSAARPGSGSRGAASIVRTTSCASGRT